MDYGRRTKEIGRYRKLYKWICFQTERTVLSIDNGKSFICLSESRIGLEAAVLKLSAVTYGEYCPEVNKSFSF